MLFTFDGEELNSDFLMFCPKQKAYVKLLEDKIKALEFKLKEQAKNEERRNNAKL